MDKRDTLEALRRQLKTVPTVKPLHYDSPERKRWEKETVRLLRTAFGDDSAEIKEFLDAPLGRFTPNMSEAEWQDNYDYLLDNQATVLERVLRMHESVGPKVGPAKPAAPDESPRPARPESPSIAVRKDPELPAHPLLQPVERTHLRLTEAGRSAVLGLENLLRNGAPWTEIRQQLIVVLNQTDRATAQAVLRALPLMLHLCKQDR